MAHTTRNKKKLLNRVGRIRGQINAIHTALEEERDCSEVLQTIASCRGAMNGLMAEVLEGHVREHILSPEQKPTADQVEAAQDVISVVRTYLK